MKFRRSGTLNTNPKWRAAGAFFKFIQRSGDEIHNMRFQGENAVFNLFRPTVVETLFILP